jgi:proliferating cell nuclear antigen
MFEITIANAKLFKDCVDALVTLIDEGEFHIGPAGVTLRAMDPSQIAMVDFSLPKSAFEKYSVPSETKIGLNVDDLSHITNRVRPGESVTLRLDKSGSRLELLFRGKTARKFNLPLLDTSGATPKEPKIDFDSKIKINGSVLKEGLKDASLVSSHVTLKADPAGFNIEAHGDKGEVLVEAKKGDDILLEHTVNRESRAMFPLEYLNDLLRVTEADVVVALDLKSDAPLRLQYPIGEANLIFYLAPRIEST